jgi:hypothetical protein
MMAGTELVPTILMTTDPEGDQLEIFGFRFYQR